MATITIRNLDEKVKRRLQVRAALNGRSMEAEARAVLSIFAGEVTPSRTDFLESKEPRPGLGTRIHSLFAPLGGVDLQLPPRRKSHREIPTFE